MSGTITSAYMILPYQLTRIRNGVVKVALNHVIIINDDYIHTRIYSCYSSYNLFLLLSVDKLDNVVDCSLFCPYTNNASYFCALQMEMV